MNPYHLHLWSSFWLTSPPLTFLLRERRFDSRRDMTIAIKMVHLLPFSLLESVNVVIVINLVMVVLVIIIIIINIIVFLNVIVIVVNVIVSQLPLSSSLTSSSSSLSTSLSQSLLSISLWMNEWIYCAIDNSLSASGQQDEQLKYHSQRFNAMSTIN